MLLRENLQERYQQLYEATPYDLIPVNFETPSINLQNLDLMDKIFHDQTPNDVYPDDYYKTIEQIVRGYGFDFEEHQVTTKDGYRLKMHRIRKPGLKKGAPAVFMQHGLMDSSNTWIANALESNGFKFAKAGYDVWLGNNRGNQYSRVHDTLNPDTQSEEFFDFSFSDLGKYDLPAQVDFVRHHTGKGKITYVGHSQGTSQMFWALAHDEDFIHHRINLFIALAPVTRLGHNTNKLIQLASKFSEPITKALRVLGKFEWFGKHFAEIQDTLCWIGPDLCHLTDSFIGFAMQYENVERVTAFRSKFPQGCSWKELMHYAQETSSGHFQEFDYGNPTANLKIYGTKTPPAIDLTKIKKVPIVMIVGEQDDLAPPGDTRWARDQVKTTVYYEEIEDFDHASFVLGKNTTYVDTVLKWAEKYNPIPHHHKTSTANLQNLYLY